MSVWEDATVFVSEDCDQASGSYSIVIPDNGQYSIDFSFLDMPYQTYDGTYWWLPDVTLVSIADGATVNVSYELIAGGWTISGALTHAGGSPAAGWIVWIANASEILYGNYVEPDGDYELQGLVPGTYFLAFSSGASGPVREWYDGVWSPREATPIPLAAFDVIVVDVEIAPESEPVLLTDIAGNPFELEIQWMADVGISTGYADHTFRPAASVTRQAMAAFMYRFAGSPAFTPPATSPFSDVPTSSPFYAEITWMADAGISTGYPDGTFRPAANVTRQAMAAFMYRFAGSPAFTPPVTSPFSDVPTSSPFYAEITWMADVGISTGYSNGTFRPAANVSRQAMAAFMYRLAGVLGGA